MKLIKNNGLLVNNKLKHSLLSDDATLQMYLQSVDIKEFRIDFNSIIMEYIDESCRIKLDNSEDV